MLFRFLSKNSISLWLIAGALGLWLILRTFNTDNGIYLLNAPQKGDIYILQAENEYAPLQLDSISEKQLFFYPYDYVFSDGLPKKSEIETSEFDQSFHAIYDLDELERLKSTSQLIQIYR